MAGEHSTDSFVARIWLEPGDCRDTTWRGHIRHVQGKEEGYFQNLVELREFLCRVSGVTGPAQVAQALTLATQSEPSAKLEPSAKSEAGTTMAQGDPKNPQAEIKWGATLFFGVLIPVLLFFWWLLIYSGGVAGNHG
jgi:hypothetical protein